MTDALRPQTASVSAESVRGMYAALDAELDGRLGSRIGFEALLGATPCELEPGAVDGFRSRYRLIKEFQDGCLALFKASLEGEADPAIAEIVLGDLPDAFAVAHHRALTERQHRTPTFFRTDELVPGTLSEIQCSGSGWDLVELKEIVYADHPDVFGAQRHFEGTLAGRFAGALRRELDAEPLIHHLTDNASRPHGMRYFIHRTRDEGLRYFGYDGDVGPQDCNFVRAHDFVSVLHHNFYADRMQRCERGSLRFDLPPSALYDSKMIMAWPFWSRTREHFSDEVRGLFPHTAVIMPEGIEMEDGQRITVEELASRPRPEKGYYLKYAGTDIAINWGSRAVFLLRTLSGPQTKELVGSIQADWTRGRYWVIQPAIRRKETVSAFTRDGDLVEADAYGKWSGYYGPGGLMAVWACHRRSHKVHGSADTIMSIAY